MLPRSCNTECRVTRTGVRVLLAPDPMGNGRFWDLALRKNNPSYYTYLFTIPHHDIPAFFSPAYYTYSRNVFPHFPLPHFTRIQSRAPAFPHSRILSTPRNIITTSCRPKAVSPMKHYRFLHCSDTILQLQINNGQFFHQHLQTNVIPIKRLRQKKKLLLTSNLRSKHFPSLAIVNTIH